MLDYVTGENAFIVESHVRPAFWPHDMRQALRCLQYEVSYADLVRRYRESYAVAVGDPQRYTRMGAAARAALDAYCSDAVTTGRMAQVMRHLGFAQTIVPLAQDRPESRRSV
jgi:hypothetical protein